MRVHNRKSKTLFGVIAKFCECRSVVHTGDWKGYFSLSDHGYINKVVLHDQNYVDPDTAVYTLSAERFWVEVRA